jgi:hypothetical protein
MSCVSACPDTATLAVALPESRIAERIDAFATAEQVPPRARETASSGIFDALRARHALLPHDPDHGKDQGGRRVAGYLCVTDSAASPATLTATLIALFVGAVMALPSLAWLYLRSQRVGRAVTTEGHSSRRSG